MAHDQPTLKSQQDQIAMLTTRSQAWLIAYNQANTRVGELMRAQLTRDQLLAECIAPLKRLHRLTAGDQPEAAPPLTDTLCLELLARIEALKEPGRAGEA
jgi:hypothetical protein